MEYTNKWNDKIEFTSFSDGESTIEVWDESGMAYNNGECGVGEFVFFSKKEAIDFFEKCLSELRTK